MASSKTAKTNFKRASIVVSAIIVILGIPSSRLVAVARKVEDWQLQLSFVILE